MPRKKRSTSDQFAIQIARWRKKLAPKYPEIDPHDLDLIIAALLKTPKQRMELMFLKKRPDGRYVF